MRRPKPDYGISFRTSTHGERRIERSVLNVASLTVLGVAVGYLGLELYRRTRP